MVAPHLRQRILARRSVTFSSAIEYLAWHAGQEIFTISLADALSWSSERTGRKLCAIGSRSASLINGYAPVQFSVSAAAERATLLSFLVKIARPHAGFAGCSTPPGTVAFGRNIPKIGRAARAPSCPDEPEPRRRRLRRPVAEHVTIKKIPIPGAAKRRRNAPSAQAPMANSAKSRASSRSASSAFSPSSRSASISSRLAPLRSPSEISSSARPA
jgi:hypothetical protein